MRIALGLLVVFGVITTAQAWTSRGAGNDSCGQFLASTYGIPPGKGQTLVQPNATYYDQSTLYAEWLQGFLSGVNIMADAATPGATQITSDYPAVDLWVRHWCEGNPTANLFKAAAAFAMQLSKR